MSITNYTGTYQNYLGYLGAKKCCELRGLGPKGDQGATGPPGPIGIGEKGQQGEQGPTGDVGPAGSSGLYCCYGRYYSSTASAVGTDPFTIPLSGTLLSNITYAVNISIYITNTTGTTFASLPNATFNLTSDPPGSGVIAYSPSTFNNSVTGYKMYLTSSSIGGSTYVYTTTITDWVLYNPPSGTTTTASPFLNVYILPSTPTGAFTIRMTASVNPVSS